MSSGLKKIDMARSDWARFAFVLEDFYIENVGALP